MAREGDGSEAPVENQPLTRNRPVSMICSQHQVPAVFELELRTGARDVKQQRVGTISKCSRTLKQQTKLANASFGKDRLVKAVKVSSPSRNTLICPRAERWLKLRRCQVVRRRISSAGAGVGFGSLGFK